jgi:hypothetical protein
MAVPSDGRGQEGGAVSRIRFTTARQVFEAFSSAAVRIDHQGAEAAPLDFLRQLIVRGHRFDAITFSAFVLPRREAVWWGCQCLRALRDGKSDDALAAAEAWVRDPDDGPRRAALAVSEAGDKRLPASWLAMAAGQSGGNVAPEGAPPRVPPPHMTGVAVKAGVILGITEKAARDQPAWTIACAEAAIRFAEGGDARVRAPPQDTRGATGAGPAQTASTSRATANRP